MILTIPHMPRCQEAEASVEACKSLPLSLLILLGMAGVAAGLYLPRVAAGLLACVDGVLRSGEPYHLCVGDVTIYQEHVVLASPWP